MTSSTSTSTPTTTAQNTTAHLFKNPPHPLPPPPPSQHLRRHLRPNPLLPPRVQRPRYRLLRHRLRQRPPRPGPHPRHAPRLSIPIAAIARKANKPLTIDLQDGYGDRLEEAIRSVIALGAVGINLEDSNQTTTEEMMDVETAVGRIKRVLEVAGE